MERVWLRQLQSAVVFTIDLDLWNEWMQNPPVVTVNDHISSSRQSLTVLRDAHRSGEVIPKPRYLSAMTWIHKNRRYYQGRKDGKPAYLGSANSTILGSRDDDKSLFKQAFPHWLQHHRKMGVEHFYIVDQEPYPAENLRELEDQPDVTYIRVPFSYADAIIDECNGANRVFRTPVFPMQYVVESTVLRMAHTDWLMVMDPDEFFVPSPDKFPNSLPQLVHHYSTQRHCDSQKPNKYTTQRNKFSLPSWLEWNEDVVACRPLSHTPFVDGIYELQFYQGFVSSSNDLTLSSDDHDYWALTKCIYNTSATTGLAVHWSQPISPRTQGSTKVSPRQGYMAHFKGGDGSFDFAALSSRLVDHFSAMTDFRDAPEGEFLPESIVEDIGIAANPSKKPIQNGIVPYYMNKPAARDGALIIEHHADRAVQNLFLAPSKTGFVTAVISVAHLDCPTQGEYQHNMSFSLLLPRGRIVQHTQDAKQAYWMRNTITTVHFEIGHKLWHNWMESPPRVQLEDSTVPKLKKKYWYQVTVDPTPKSHFLSAITWINKSRRYYRGRGVGPTHSISEKDGDANKGIDQRNDTETLRIVNAWLDYHTKVGVSHFYIIDQDNNLYAPNIKALASHPNITYIRAPFSHLDYYVDKCDANFNRTHRLRDITGQYALETTVQRMAKTEWMLVTDPDEFITPANGFSSLQELIRFYASVHCEGPPIKSKITKSVLPSWDSWKNVTCQKLPEDKEIFELQFYQALIDKENKLTYSSDKFDTWALTKCIYRTHLLAGNIVHYGYPLDSTRHLSSKVSPRQGFMAHYQFGGPFDWPSLLPKAIDHAERLPMWDLPAGHNNATSEM